MSHAEPAPEVHAAPACPRHPDRVSYVSCQRCGRPVCPDCQRPAPVGVQCVDCVREAAAARPAVRTVFGAVARPGRPLVTFSLIGACVAVFAGQWVPGLHLTEALIYAPVFTDLQPWRMLTAGFLHSTGFIFHILLNMYMLWMLGQSLEPLYGRARFAAVYLLSVFGGSVGVLLLANPGDPNSWYAGVLGASGGVFGLFGALAVTQRRLGNDIGQLLVLILINTGLGFVMSGISWQAHLGGLATGAAAGAVIAYAKGNSRTALHAGGLAFIAAFLVAASAAKMAFA